LCPDQNLYDVVEIAVRSYSSVDDICNAIRELLVGYRSLLWSVNVLVYTRATADLLPVHQATSQNVCFLTVNSKNIIVFVASIASSL
uniref:Ovule protein n=1 Tax=Heligmosomoides polygyrus TaxID=6339 RepID=A0A183FM44_HELPZ